MGREGGRGQGPALIRTARLRLFRVSWSDALELAALKADPRIYGSMLGGVRSPIQAAHEAAAEVAFWGAHGVGMFAVRDLTGRLIGTTGIHQRPDGRDLALRFAFDPASRGHGLAREAASAALRYAHDRAGLPRVVAVAREDNVASRSVLGGIGMRHVDTFIRDRDVMMLYESRRAG